MSKPVSQPVVQPVVQPTSQPVVQPDRQPISQRSTPQMNRRVVFAGAGTAGALAAAAALLPRVQTEALAPPAARAGADDTGGYQLTEHVLRYYQTARV